jgi:hypothetical protein
MGKLHFHSFQKGDRTEYFSHGGSVDPKRLFNREVSKKSHPLGQFLSKPFFDKASQKEIGSKEDEDECEDNVIKEVDHRAIETMPNAKVPISNQILSSNVKNILDFGL